MMKKLNNLGLIIVIYLLFTFCNNEIDSRQSSTISGIIKGLKQSWIVLNELEPGAMNRLDSVLTDDIGNFSLSFKVSETSIYALQLLNGEMIVFIAGPGEIIELISEFPQTISNYSIIGSNESNLLREYLQYTYHNEQKFDSLRQIFENSKYDPGFLAIRKMLEAEYLQIYQDQQEYAKRFINNNPGTLTSLVILNRRFVQTKLFDDENDYSLLELVDSAFIMNYPENKHSKAYHEKFLNIKKRLANKNLREQNISIGMPVPSFKIPDLNGKKVSVDDFRGSPIIIYFWASWEAPCRKTNKKLNTLLEEKDNENIIVFAISFDQDPDSWKAAIEIDELNWLHVGDLKGFSSPVIHLFNLRDRLPYFILLDKNGVIRYKGKDISELRVEVKELN